LKNLLEGMNQVVAYLESWLIEAICGSGLITPRFIPTRELEEFAKLSFLNTYNLMFYAKSTFDHFLNSDLVSDLKI